MTILQGRWLQLTQSYCGATLAIILRILKSSLGQDRAVWAREVGNEDASEPYVGVVGSRGNSGNTKSSVESRDISSSGREGSFSHDVVFYSTVVVVVLPSSSGW